ncbi:MAG TPA: copper chaperone PCu(A)C [Gammaproteobacteria bacterium]|nr:copper chaperone PCu(A)C [Gammaproteobacteria bacterium]
MKLVFKAFFLSLLFTSACYAANALTFIQPHVAEAPPGARVMAAFMEIHNSATQDIRIEQISSPDFERVEMHLSSENNGIASMQQQKFLTVKADSTLKLASGGYHLMLIKPAKRYFEGDSVTLGFSLSNGKTLKLSVPVKKTSGTKKSASMPSGGKCGSGKCGGAK